MHEIPGSLSRQVKGLFALNKWTILQEKIRLENDIDIRSNETSQVKQ